MSLYRGLWLAIVVSLFLVLSASFLATTLSARSYLQQQLSTSNANGAVSLALSPGWQSGNNASLQAMLSAQFETGFYELIELRNPEGKLLVLLQEQEPGRHAPAWFMSLLPINAEDGLAKVRSQGAELGTLMLRKQRGFAYEHLWRSTRVLASIYLVVIILAGVMATLALKRLLRPLDNAVEHAQAMAAKRFTVIDEPGTAEFRQLARAMNELSSRMKHTLNQEARRLQKWQREAHVDKVTGLSHRDPFLKAVAAALESDDADATGGISLVRLTGLARLNQVFGRSSMDAVLHDIGKELSRITVQHSGWTAARLNGSDFALLAPRAIDPAEIAGMTQAAVREVLERNSMADGVLLPAAGTIYSHGETTGKILTRLDGAILANEREGESSISVAYAGDIQMQPVRQQMNQWREILDQAFRENSFELDLFPLWGQDRELIHFEAPVRLSRGSQRFSAGEFLPWVNRLQLSAELDMAVVDLALQTIQSEARPIAINLSAASVVESAFVSWIGERLTSRNQAAGLLWMEVPEAIALRHLENFKLLCGRVKSSGCKIGIEHVGHQLSELGRLGDIGIDYLKIDASFVRDIDDNVANQTLLRTLCTVGHSIGLQVYAEGVHTGEEWATLQELGADGATGPGMAQPD